MLSLLFRVSTTVDRALASRGQRGDAEWYAFTARMHHGDRAIHHLHGLLTDGRRRRSRRSIRLAVAEVIAMERRARR